MWEIQLFGAICVSLVVHLCGLDLSQQSIEAGKKQYGILQQKAQIPNYGSCWTSALESLHQDCKNLDDATQMRLALRFASCFLEASGLRPIACSADSDVRRCTGGLSDRQFDSYREFFTHTHNMCSFLQVQVWHRETGRVVSRLGSEAAAVAERLEKSGSLQADILLSQQQALSNQQQLINHGQRLSNDVDRWRNSLLTMVQEFREQTDEHRDLILTVFERLTSLQQLVLDRFSWFNSLAHYLAGVLLVYLLTATARTASARPLLFLVLTCNLGVERLLAAYLLSPSPLQPSDAQETAAALERGVWLLRRAAGTLCLLLLAGAVYRYRDINAANNRLLQELHKQHVELRRCLAANGMPLSGASEPDWSTSCTKAARHLSGGQCLDGPAANGVDVSLFRRSSNLVCEAGGDTVDVARVDCKGAVPEPEASRRTSERPGTTVALLARLSGCSTPPSGELSPAPSPQREGSGTELLMSRCSTAPPPRRESSELLMSRCSTAPPPRRESSQLLMSRHSPAPSPLREGSGKELVLLRNSPTPQRSRSGTPQAAAEGRYNLRARASPVSPPPQSPESMSRRLGALARQHDVLVRRALRRS